MTTVRCAANSRAAVSPLSAATKAMESAWVCSRARELMCVVARTIAEAPPAVMANHMRVRSAMFARADLVFVCGENWRNRGNNGSIIKIHETHTCCGTSLTGDLLDPGSHGNTV